MSSIKQTITKLFFCASFIICFSNCATIIGGDTYRAHVSVKDHPNAVIKYKGLNKGRGSASIVVKRSQANKFALTVEEEGCAPKSDTFTSRSLRVGALVASLLFTTGSTAGGIPLPWGLGLDLATGALWKPNVTENGVTKSDYKNFNYEIDYSGCVSINKTVEKKSKADRLRELKDLLDKNILTKEEFEIEKKKVLSEN